MNQRRISVIGTGYVGLSTALGFTSKDFTVIASDPDKTKIKMINEGNLPFHEPNLQEPLTKAIQNGNLSITKCEEAIASTDITFIAVGTPSRPDGSINLKFIEKATGEIGNALKKKRAYHLIVIKSTVTPTTTEKRLKPIIEAQSDKNCGIDFGLCMNPEFLREGSAFHDVLHPDRLIIGEYDIKSGDYLEALYQEFYMDNIPPILRTNIPTAELIKYASNAFLATKISYINTIANICEKIPNVDVTLVAKGMGLDKRIGSQFLNAGLGYGGSCFPKDTKALIFYSKSVGYNPDLLKSVEVVNKLQPHITIKKIKNLIVDLKGKNIAILGLSFKPNTDDMREAVSIPIIKLLLEENANVTAYDPIAINNAKTIFNENISYASSAIQCIKNADCCIIVTECEEFKNLKPEDFIKNMKQPFLIDGRRIYNQKEFCQKMKFVAIGLGQIYDSPLK
ncbi:MAG: UDP-glucose/GDP-mannose dehydrogenase family protein [Candidatus Bathyarchaeia archaeon]|jgi:UDPglucose 6-dehydrogenase